MNDFALPHATLQAVIDAVESGLILLDTEGRILRWNRWLVRYSGIAAKDAEQRLLSEVLPETGNTRLTLAVQHACRNGLPSLLSPALHGTLLPLYRSADDRAHSLRLQQLTHVIPVRHDSRAACLIQITDVTANISRERQLRQQTDQLRRAATLDPVTGLSNRKSFDEIFEREFRHAIQSQQSIGLMMIDIEHLHGISELFGREEGDRVLRELAKAFSAAFARHRTPPDASPPTRSWCSCRHVAQAPCAHPVATFSGRPEIFACPPGNPSSFIAALQPCDRPRKLTRTPSFPPPRSPCFMPLMKHPAELSVSMPTRAISSTAPATAAMSVAAVSLIRRASRFSSGLAVLLGLLLIGPAHAELPASVADALRAAHIPETAVGVIVQPVDAGQPLIAHNTALAMNPASVMKLLTTYAALDLLGPAFTWQTGGWSDAPTVNSSLQGNFYLKGSGDPRLAIEDLSDLLRQLRVRGIKRIEGDIILDRSAFQNEPFDPAAFDNKPLRPYNVGPNALLLNFQSLRFTLQSAPGQPRVLLESPSHGLMLDNRLKTTAGACGSDWKDRITLRLLAVGGQQRLDISGSYAEQCNERVLNLAPLSPDSHADGLIRALWSELGGQLAGRIREGRTPPGAQLLVRHESPPLADIIRDINKFSNNVMARQVFQSLSSETPASTESARRRIAGWLESRGLRFGELVMDNGSGLSRIERISAGSLNRLLLDAWRHPLMAEFMASMPVAGVDGTLKKRLTDSPVTARAHIKTGTLDGVKTAAGYVQDAGGRRHAVTFLINDSRAQSGGPAIDALLNWVAERP